MSAPRAEVDARLARLRYVEGLALGREYATGSWKLELDQDGALYPTFEEYCARRYGFSRTLGYYLMDMVTTFSFEEFMRHGYSKLMYVVRLPAGPKRDAVMSRIERGCSRRQVQLLVTSLKTERRSTGRKAMPVPPNERREGRGGLGPALPNVRRGIRRVA